MEFQFDNHLELQEIIGKTLDSEPPGQPDNSDLIEWLESMAKYHSEHPKARHALYDSVVGRALELRTHFNYDSPISDKIASKRPTESEVYLKYRENAWEPTTYSWTQKAVNFFNKLFNPQLSSIEYNNIETPGIAEGEDIETYMKGLIPKYVSESNFNRNFALRATLQDPDGWIVILSNTPIDEREVNSLPDPFPQYIPSEAVIEYSDEFLFVRSPERIELEGGLGSIFFCWTKFGIFRIEQFGELKNFSFNVFEIDRFERDSIPAKQLKGIPKLDFYSYLTTDCKIEYDSHIQPMIPFLNKLMQLSSDIDAMMAMHMYLQKMEVKTNCKTCDGKKYLSHKEGGNYPCPSCDGEGFDKISIFDTMRIGQAAFKELKGLPDLVKYVKIPTEIIEKVFERENTYREQAFEAVNLEFLVRKAVSGVESAKKVQLEQAPLHVMLAAIAKDVFETAQHVADWINIIRYGPTLGVNLIDNRPIYKTPDKFDIESSADAVNELEKVSKLDNVPSAVLEKLILNASSRKYGEDSSAYKAIESEVLLDPLLGRDEGEILSGLDSGLIPRIDANIHYNLRAYLSNLREVDPSFDDLDINERRLRLYSVPELESVEIVPNLDNN